MAGLDIFIGGGGDDLAWLGLGVVRSYAQAYAGQTGREVLYLPNARIGRALRAIAAASRAGRFVTLIGHSWGGPDAYVAAVRALRAGHDVRALVTLDPVSGPLRRAPPWPGGPRWISAQAVTQSPDDSDRLTRLRPFAHKPPRLPLARAGRAVEVAAHHWDVATLMTKSGARALLDRLHEDPGC